LNSFPEKSRNIRWEDHHSCPMLDLRAETGVSLSCVDAMSVAVQMGRLDSIAITLGALAVLLVIAGIFSYINFDRIARTTAEEVASSVARVAVEEAVKSAVAEEFKKIERRRREFFEGDPGDFDELSRSQD